MYEPSQPAQSPSSGGRSSRSWVGRGSGVVSWIFASSGSLQATSRFLRRQLWAWPVIAAVLLGGAGWWVYHSVENAMREQRAVDLNATVDASATALRVWMGEQRINVQLFAEDPRVRPLVSELIPLADGTPAAERRLVQAKAQ